MIPLCGRGPLSPPNPSAALVLRLSPAVGTPSTGLRNSRKDHEKIGLSAQTVLGLRLWRTVAGVLTRVPERLSKSACSEKGSDRGKRYLFLRNALRGSRRPLPSNLDASTSRKGRVACGALVSVGARNHNLRALHGFLGTTLPGRASFRAPPASLRGRPFPGSSG